MLANLKIHCQDGKVCPEKVAENKTVLVLTFQG